MTCFCQKEVKDFKINYTSINESLKDIFEDLEEQYGIRFSYASSTLAETKVSADFQDESIENVLDFLLANNELEYRIIDDNVLLRKFDFASGFDEDGKSPSLHVRGKVLNTYGEHIPVEWAAVSIEGSPIGTFTDENGYFDIDIPNEYLDNILTIHYLGFEDVSFKIQDLSKEMLMVQLSVGSFSVDEVIIVNKEKTVKLDNSINSIGLSSAQMESLTSGIHGPDLSKQLQSLPGIAAFDDGSADIQIRGSNHDETLIVLDGIPIYDASHYFGMFNSINPSYLDKVSLYKNAFPLEYGGKTAGIVALSSQDDIVDSLQWKTQLNLLTGASHLVVPIGKKSNLHIAGRTTYGDINNEQFNTWNINSDQNLGTNVVQSFGDKIPKRKSSPRFRFYDINAKYDIHFNDSTALNINLFRSQDQFDNFFKTEVRDNGNNKLKIESDQEEDWENLGLSAQFKHVFKNGVELYSTVFKSKYIKESDTKIELLEEKHSMMDSPLKEIRAKLDNSIDDTGIELYTCIPIRKNELKFGVETTHHDVFYDFKDNNQVKFKSENSVFETSVFGGYTLLMIPNLTLRTGLRVNHYNKELFLSPRVYANYDLGQGLQVKGSYSYYQQFIRGLNYDYRGEVKTIWINAGHNIKVLQSQNYMLGFTSKHQRWSLDVEVYRKIRQGVLEYAVVNPANNMFFNNIPQDYTLFTGDGLTNGVDVMLSVEWQGVDSYVSYTYGINKQRFKAIAKNQYYASDNDRRHQWSWVNQKQIQQFYFGVNWTYVSGRPYTDISNLDTNVDIRDANPNDRISYLPAYQRLDLSIDYKFNIGQTKSSIGLSLFNALNNQNVKYIQTINSEVTPNEITLNTVVGNESSLLSRTWNINFSFSL